MMTLARFDASAIRAQRAELVARMLGDAVRRQEVTVGCELLAYDLVDRFAGAVETRGWEAFFEWIEAMLDGSGEVSSIPRRLTLSLATLAASFTSTSASAAPMPADFGWVAERINAIAVRPRSVLTTRASKTLDEIDVALDRLMSRLTQFDSATADHSRAVSMWCARIARRMSLSRAEITFVTRAGLIHDIGKTTTPLDILNAPYRLSDDQMEIMRDHAAAGAAIVAEIPLLAHLVPAVRGHHERIDGRGYPDGRSGSEIPLAVRIVSVADSFNAMIGNRPYRLPMAPTAALEQLNAHRDTQFDRDVVRAMNEVVLLPRA